MAGQTFNQWIPLQINPQSTAYKGAYAEVGHVPNNERPEYCRKSFRQKYLSGVKRTLRAFAVVALIVLLVNISWFAYAKTKYGIVNGVGTIKSGSCSEVKNLNTWLHFVINILSTLLLTGSNAFMAAYSCPSRKEVDKAHYRGRFLHVGSLSLGNLRGIAKRKALVVLVLLLSSAPFHLFYNSLVFESLATNEYYYSIVTEDFLTGASFNLTGPWLKGWDNITYPYFNATTPNRSSAPTDSMKLEQVMDEYFTDIQQSASKWQRLANVDCVKAYSNLFLPTRRNVVLVSSIKNDTNSILYYGNVDFHVTSDLDDNWWLCSMTKNDGGNQYCNPDEHISTTGNWSVWSLPVEYCLSQEVEDTCSVQFSSTIMLVVIGFTSLKLFMMTWVLFRYDAEQILTSTGDAAASFLRFEDQSTMMMCLANKREMRKFWESRGFARPFSHRRRSWGSAVSKRRIVSFLCLMIFAFIAIAVFGGWGFSHIKAKGISLSLSSVWSLGFGKINQNAIVFLDPFIDIITAALVANIPQVILSLVYLTYMGIMTTMFLAADWTVFAVKPQTLMVSSPSGSQRGTWMFGAPMGWGLTLLAFQTLLHWLVSQSLFVVQMQVFFKDGTPKTWDPRIVDRQDAHFTNCGYSPLAILLSTVAAGILLLSAIAFLLRKFPAGSPPIASTCSAAISAQCHPVNKREDMPYKELRWGVDGGFSNGVGHCSLVLAEAWDTGRSGPPLEGYTYAGYRDDER